MDWVQALVLGLIQGVTEFLPISSSAHLILPAQVLGWIDQGLAFDVAVHVGTLAAVMIYFFKDLRQIVSGSLQLCQGRYRSDEARLAWFIIGATIPALVFGVLITLMGWDELMRSVAVIATTTIVFGLLLGWADIKASQRFGFSDLNFRRSMIIGFAQVLSLIPGTSRSGITMTAGLMLGLDRQAAARFSFLLSMPIIAAAGSLKVLQLVLQDGPVDWSILSFGALVSGVSAFICIHLFLGLINRLGMLPFVIYRLLLGAVLVAFCFGLLG